MLRTPDGTWEHRLSKILVTAADSRLQLLAQTLHSLVMLTVMGEQILCTELILERISEFEPDSSPRQRLGNGRT